MADANPKVMEMVETELKKNPDISNKDLREKARSIDKGVDKLSPRQFNAIYPLQVKRAMKPRRRRATGGQSGKKGRKAAAGPSRTPSRGARRTAGNGGDREQVRKVLVELARNVAEGDRGALVDVVAGIDRYVERVMKAAS